MQIHVSTPGLISEERKREEHQDWSRAKKREMEVRSTCTIRSRMELGRVGYVYYNVSYIIAKIIDSTGAFDGETEV